MESSHLWVPDKDEGGETILNLYLDGVTYLYEQLDELKDGVEDEFIKNYYLKFLSNQPTYISEAFGIYDNKEDEEEDIKFESFIRLQTIQLVIYNKIEDKNIKKEYYRQFNKKKGKMLIKFKLWRGSTKERYTLTAHNLERESQRSPQIRRFLDGHT